MPRTDPGNSPNPSMSAWIVVAMLALVAIPAAITLHSIRSAGTLQMTSPNPTPYGYTWSLMLFIVPIVVIAFWFLPREAVKVPKKAFWWTIGALVPVGFALDFFFAQWFFVFPNPDATLGIKAPALGSPVPIEEYLFYFTGFIAILLLYVWLDEFWLAAYNMPDYPGEAKKIHRLLKFHPSSLVWAVALIVAAIIYKKFFSGHPEGFPAYFTVLVAGGLVPSVTFFPAARPFINWRALSLTLFFIVLVSLVWEATLAMPYGWWGYQPKQMMGLSIGAWFGLPIEAIFVWIAASYATVVVFEIIKVWHASEKGLKDAFWGTKESSAKKRGKAAGG